MAIVLIAYGAVLAVLSLFLKQNSPPTETLAPTAGLLGAALCVVWGVICVLTRRGRMYPLLVLVVLSLIFLGETVDGWSQLLAKPAEGVLVPILLSVCFLVTLAVMVYLLYAERPASFWTGRRAGQPAPPPQSNS